jgi:hypothetical protein
LKSFSGARKFEELIFILAQGAAPPSLQLNAALQLENPFTIVPALVAFSIRLEVARRPFKIACHFFAIKCDGYCFSSRQIINVAMLCSVNHCFHFLRIFGLFIVLEISIFSLLQLLIILLHFYFAESDKLSFHFL